MHPYSGSREHMLLAEIWSSANKPPISECLAPIVHELESLATNGMVYSMLNCIRELVDSLCRTCVVHFKSLKTFKCFDSKAL